MQAIIGPTMLGIGTILVSSMFAVLKSLDRVHPIVRASWRLQTTFLALAAPSALSIYLATTNSNNRDHKNKRNCKSFVLPPVATVWSGCGYALYNVGLCTALAETSLLRASILSQCAPLFIVLYNIFCNRCYPQHHFENGARGGVHWKHILGVVLTLVGTGIYISSTSTSDETSLGTSTKDSRGEQEVVLEFDSTGHERSFILGDLAAAVASAGYATYISCGRQARRVVPVYIHLPGCVFVAMILVSAACLMVVDNPTFEDSAGAASIHDDYNDAFIGRKNTIPTPNELYHLDGANSDFCSYLLGWTCQKYLPRIAFLGVVCGAIAVGLINWSLNHVSALQAAAANSAEPIAASIIGVIFFAEPIPNITAIAAAGIIVFAMMLCSTDDGTNHKSISSGSDNKNCEAIEVKGKKMISSRARRCVPDTC